MNSFNSMNRNLVTHVNNGFNYTTAAIAFTSFQTGYSHSICIDPSLNIFFTNAVGTLSKINTVGTPAMIKITT